MRIGGLLLMLALSACAPSVVVPDTASVRSMPAKRQMHLDYQLTFHDGVFLRTWQRKDETLHRPQLDGLAASYPKAEAVLTEAKWRDSVLVALPMTGALLGAAAATAVMDAIGRHGETEPWASGNPLYGMWATAGLLIISPLIVSLIWDEPLKKFHTTYNDALRRDLGLAPER
jgi:hypothetical protein